MERNTSLFLDFFRLLDERKIAHCVVGDSRGFPQNIASDVDIVIAQSQVARLPELLSEYCDQHHLKLVQHLCHEHQAHYFVVQWQQFDGTPAFLALDICGDYRRRGRRLLSAEELLANAQTAFDSQGNSRGFNVAASAFEFCYYLLKRIDKQGIDARHAEHLTREWHKDRAAAEQLLKRFWGSTAESRLLTRAADAGDWSSIARQLSRMRAAMHRRTPIRFADMLRETARRYLRWRQPTGLMVAFLGPDGSGKSSVILAAQDLIREAFRQTRVVHLRPGFLYRPVREATRTPQAGKPRGVIRSTIKLWYFVADYFLGYQFRSRPLLVRSTALLFDRYYDDLLVDPRRYRHTGSARVARWLRAFAPRPDLWILLDAPTAVLQARKQEVPPEESERQRAAYREVLSDQTHVVILDATLPLAKVANDAAQAILSCAEARTRSRLALHSREHRSPLPARWLMFCCRHRIPLLSKMMRVLFNSDIYCKLPKDLYLPHPYGIVIHSQTHLGRGVTVMQQVTLGGKDVGRNVAPIIGDDVYLGAGARVLGNVRIGNGAIVGANAVITRDVPAGATVVGANRILAEANATQARTLLRLLPDDDYANEYTNEHTEEYSTEYANDGDVEAIAIFPGGRG